MNSPFFLHVNNHANAESEKTLRAKLGKIISNFASGYRVKITPMRRKPSYTFAGVILGDEFHIGIAKCHPNDQFCKRVGRIKAEGRTRGSKDMFVVKIPDIVLAENKTGRFFAETCREIAETYYSEI